MKFVVIALLSLPAVASADPQPRLFDPDPARITTDAGGALSARRAGNRSVLRVEVDHHRPWPGIHLPAPAGDWDLSAFAYVDVLLGNPTEHPVRVDVRIDSPGGDGQFHCCSDGATLPPKGEGSVRVALRREKPPWVKVELQGMKGFPWGMPRDWGLPGEGTLDAAHVTQLIIYSPHPREDGAFEVLDVRAGGVYPPPTRLLEDPGRFFPFIDSFGQFIHRDWPGKTHELADLATARRNEAADLDAHPGPSSWDRFGGWKDGPALNATGFFRTEKRDGKWWLVDPDGRLFFSSGIDAISLDEGGTPIDRRGNWFASLPAADGPLASCYSTAWQVALGDYAGAHPRCFNFARANVIRKYDGDIDVYDNIIHRRLRSWGINTIGNWSSHEVYGKRKTPYVVTFYSGGPPLAGSTGYWGKFRDPFDPAFRQSLRQSVHDEIGSSAADPLCVGYFVDNELSWSDDDISLAAATLRSPGAQAAKKAFIAQLQKHYGEVGNLNSTWKSNYGTWEDLLASTNFTPGDNSRADLITFQRHLCETYFRTIRETLKAAAPNHLYLGCRFAAVNGVAAAAAAEFCDVVSFNIYRKTPESSAIQMTADVPILIGEFHFGALDRGLFHTGLYAVGDQAERAEHYRQYVIAALKDPRIVGCHWYEYMDEPTVGRYFDGENYQIGFVDVADAPYREIIAASREVGQTMYGIRNP